MQKDTGPWAGFRKLLGYYADCVRNDQGSEASANLNDLGRRFVPLNGVGTWYPRTGRPWNMRLLPNPEVGAVIRHLEGSGDAGVLVLGYPLWVHSPPTDDGEPREPFLKPIFTCVVEYEASAEAIRIWADEPSLDVNLDWLSYALRKPEQQRAFLAMAGLMDRRGPEDELGDGSGHVLTPDLRSLATAVSTFFGEQIREPLKPEAPSPLSASIRPKSGIYNHAVLMAGNRTKYSQSLLRDLAKIRRCPDEALDRTSLRPIFRQQDGQQSSSLANDGPSNKATSSIDVIDTCDLNAEQRGAIASILAEDVTVVTGPPGTGKSQVVSGAIGNARLSGSTVLFSSRNHKAIDAVVGRPEMTTSDERPLIVRANDKEGSISFTFADALKELLSSPHDPTATGRLLELQRRIEPLSARRHSLVMTSEKRESIREDLTELETFLTETARDWTPEETRALGDDPDGFPAARAKKLEAALPPLPHDISSLPWWKRAVLWLRSRRARHLATELRQSLPAELSGWAGGLDHTDLESLPSIAAIAAKLTLASRYAEARLAQKPLEIRASQLPPLTRLTEQIREATVELRGLALQALEADVQARSGLPGGADRSGFASLQVAMRRQPNALVAPDTDENAKAALKENLPHLLSHFPVWAVTNLSIGSRMTLAPAIFDVAIIDEASQCDIASAIPVLFRAKRAAVIGDPFQLAHTTKLTRSRDNVLCRKNGVTSLREQRFSFTDTSLFDLFSQTNGVNPAFLRNHYRCAPEIAEYANRVFYGSRLRVITAADRLRVPQGRTAGIHWTAVESELEPRRTGCVAPAEVAECKTILRTLLLDQAFEGTVGVVTPFREQKQLLQEEVFSDSELAQATGRANLVIDTAHGFQGDERDVMLMSLCSGPSMPTTSLGWLRKTGNLLNVAATRARAVLHIIGNRAWAESCGIPHITALARPSRRSSASTRITTSPFESPWEKRLFDALEARGLKPVPQYPLLGRRLDLALIDGGRTPIDIEVDGARYHQEPDGSRRRDDIWRDITVQGAGWKVLRFWVYELRDDMDSCVERIAQEWDSR